MSLGTFPDVSLKDVRKKRNELRASIVDGADPVQEKRQRRLKDELAAATTVALVTEEFIEKMGERENPLPPSRKSGGF